MVVQNGSGSRRQDRHRNKAVGLRETEPWFRIIVWQRSTLENIDNGNTTGIMATAAIVAPSHADKRLLGPDSDPLANQSLRFGNPGSVALAFLRQIWLLKWRRIRLNLELSIKPICSQSLDYNAIGCPM
ncbi:hypothetical protein V6N12_021715 [Hibiscus sabdariffa]|uniref:Uncharacterized protein n=1 Tax=Hibiscus sabdariffa TaxID=183260 RepID=A0ABR2FSI9_9ROSI